MGPQYYVAPNGKDRPEHGSKEKPWATIQYGIKRIGRGDTLVLRDGIYNEHVTVSTDGTADKPIRLVAENRHQAIIDGGWPKYTGEKPNWGKKPIVTSSAWVPLINVMGDHVEIDGIVVRNSASRGIQTLGCRHATIKNCQVEHTYKKWIDDHQIAPCRHH